MDPDHALGGARGIGWDARVDVEGARYVTPWLLIPVSLLALYALFQMLAITFFCIEVYHEIKRQTVTQASPREGVELLKERET